MGNVNTPTDWVMPNSAYNHDFDTQRGYYAIKDSSERFHKDLRSEAERFLSLERANPPKTGAGTPQPLDLRHHDKAMKVVLGIFLKRHRSRDELVLSIVAEFVLVLGGILITPLFSETYNWLTRTAGATQPNLTSLLFAILGGMLIAIKIIMTYK